MKYTNTLFMLLAVCNGLIMGTFTFVLFFMPYAILQFSSSPPSQGTQSFLVNFSLGMTGISVLVGGVFGWYMANLFIKETQLKLQHFILVNIPFYILLGIFLRTKILGNSYEAPLETAEQITQEDKVEIQSFQVSSINSERLVLLLDFNIDNISNTKYIAEVKFADSAYNTTFFKLQQEIKPGMTVEKFDVDVQELLKAFFTQPQVSKFDGSYLPVQAIEAHVEIYSVVFENNRFQQPKASAQLILSKDELDPFIKR